MNFSIVIPVYNVEKYIEKCIESVINQTYKDFEVIIVNDGSKDNSQKIIDKYVKNDKRIKSYIKENGGLSDARNFGVTKTNGEYLVFLDSDDYLELDLLEKVNEVVETKKYDIVRFLLNLVSENKELIKKESVYDIGEITFEQILKYEYVETAYSNIYNAKFFKEKNYKYEKGRIHEDYGLTPLILAQAKSIYLLNMHGLNYLQREGSIVNGAEKNVKRVNDKIYLYDKMLENINEKVKEEKKRKYLESFMANGLIDAMILLNNTESKKYKVELKRRRVIDKLLDNNFKRFLKKLYYRVKFI